MVKKSSICSAVEGAKLTFNTRQFYSKPPIYQAQLKQNVYPFKLGINGYVEIETSLEDPATKVYETSLTDTGDVVQGGSIDGWTTRPIKPVTVSKATGTHSAQFGSVRGHAYAHVESSHRDHLQSTDIESRHPQIVEVLNPRYFTPEAEIAPK
jgi:hypothetical protein